MATLQTYALTTVADVKELLGISSGDSSKNNLIIRKINQSTAMIETWCNLPRDHHFAETAYTQEEYNGSNSRNLILRMNPVNSGETFTLERRNTTLNESSWETIDTEFYHIDYKIGMIEAVFLFLPSPHLYRVTFTAGYSTIPDDLAEACAIISAHYVENATSGTNVASKSEGQRSISYFQPTEGQSLIQSLGIDDILSRYERIPFVEK